MSLVPVVRYMILCEDWGMDPLVPGRVNIYGLLTNLRSTNNPPYPFVIPHIFVYLVLTETRGTGSVQLNGVLEETGQLVFRRLTKTIDFGNDPLAIRPFRLRLSNCRFPRAGNYAIGVWYNGVRMAERLLRLE